MQMCGVSLTKVAIFLNLIILDKKTADENVAEDSPKKEGHWVAVVFDSEWFPGQILRVEGSNLVISFMRKSKSFFLWPQKLDVQIIPENEILCTLEEPIKTSSRLFKFENMIKVDSLLEALE